MKLSALRKAALDGIDVRVDLVRADPPTFEELFPNLKLKLPAFPSIKIPPLPSVVITLDPAAKERLRLAEERLRSVFAALQAAGAAK